MTTSSTPEDTIAECKRRVKECYALLEKYDCARVSPSIIGHGRSMDEDRSKRGNNPRKIGDDVRSLATIVEVESQAK